MEIKKCIFSMPITCSRCGVQGHKKNSKKCSLFSNFEHTSLIKQGSQQNIITNTANEYLMFVLIKMLPLNEKLKQIRLIKTILRLN